MFFTFACVFQRQVNIGHTVDQAIVAGIFSVVLEKEFKFRWNCDRPCMPTHAQIKIQMIML